MYFTVCLQRQLCLTLFYFKNFFFLLVVWIASLFNQVLVISPKKVLGKQLVYFILFYFLIGWIMSGVFLICCCIDSCCQSQTSNHWIHWSRWYLFMHFSTYMCGLFVQFLSSNLIRKKKKIKKSKQVIYWMWFVQLDCVGGDILGLMALLPQFLCLKIFMLYIYLGGKV